jgi:rhomboid family GlyGly-CTERM serine protease
MALPEPVPAHLALAPQAIFAGEWWRLWTGHFVHFSAPHAIAGLSVILFCGLYVEKACSARAYVVFWLLTPALLSCLLLLTVPDLAEYRGASGLATTLAVIFGLVLWREQPRLRLILLLLGILFAFKTTLEVFQLPFNIVIVNLPSDIQTIWQVHVLGALLGILWYFGMCKLTCCPNTNKNRMR